MWFIKVINKNSGLTLIEVLVTLAILGIIIVPLSSFFITSAKINNDSRDKFKATLIAQQLMEDIKLSDSIVEGESQYNIENYDVIVNISSVSDFTELESSNFYDTIDYDIKIQIDKNNENYISIYDKDDNELANVCISIEAVIYVEMTDSFITVKVFDNDILVIDKDLSNFENEGKVMFEILGDMNFEVKSKNQTENDLVLYFCKSADPTSNYSFSNLGGKIIRYENILIPNKENESSLKGLYKIDIEVKKGELTLEKITGYKSFVN